MALENSWVNLGTTSFGEKLFLLTVSAHIISETSSRVLAKWSTKYLKAYLKDHTDEEILAVNADPGKR